MTTVGVAIPIPQPWGRQLDEARARTGDPQAPHVPSHVTLLGPTEVAAERMDTVEQHLARAAADHHAFEIHLRGSGTFRPVTEVVFVTVARGISECEKLEAVVRSGPLQKELTYPYHPHVTVAQSVPTEALDAVFEELADFEARFAVAGFTLYTHDADATWRPRREFGFGE
ncbi:2'-5' RNA ligase family protein [Stackebrandtia albiflava]|uniref:2'-5' RNA ligase family protein n=1 Tax=Stackebrandtia albiflava TaxID=406432 RepID=UPI001FCE8011|nr:2'-5' RNA ligase family protein [Stackebrandtia albiflava]